MNNSNTFFKRWRRPRRWTACEFTECFLSHKYNYSFVLRNKNVILSRVSTWFVFFFLVCLVLCLCIEHSMESHFWWLSHWLLNFYHLYYAWCHICRRRTNITIGIIICWPEKKNQTNNLGVAQKAPFQKPNLFANGIRLISDCHK